MVSRVQRGDPHLGRTTSIGLGKCAGNACGAVSEEVKVFVLMGIGEKSGILVDGTDSCANAITFGAIAGLIGFE